jgi:hypothetical protein
MLQAFGPTDRDHDSVTQQPAGAAPIRSYEDVPGIRLLLGPRDLAVRECNITPDPRELRLGDEQRTLHIVIMAEPREPAGEDVERKGEGDRNDGERQQDLDQGETITSPRPPQGQGDRI